MRAGVGVGWWRVGSPPIPPSCPPLLPPPFWTLALYQEFPRGIVSHPHLYLPAYYLPSCRYYPPPPSTYPPHLYLHLHFILTLTHPHIHLHLHHHLPSSSPSSRPSSSTRRQMMIQAAQRGLPINTYAPLC
jgi:hypothetical protein